MLPLFPRIGGLDGIAALRTRLHELGLALPADDEPLSAPSSPLAQPLDLGAVNGTRRVAANRFVIQPMEGWDGSADGQPSDLTVRRWRNFGRSGAAWIWGGEAVAVRPEGRANPHQLIMNDATAASIGTLRRELIEAGQGGDLVVGLQLTHSGRWSRPISGGAAPRIAFRHPLLDPRSGVHDDSPLLSDMEVDDLIRTFARAAYLAQEEGFEFVDVKHCHGYLLHEFLAARTRHGHWGGPTLGERSRLAVAVIEAVRTAAPRLAIGVRLSAFDCVPYRPASIDADGKRGPGIPEEHSQPYGYGFGVDLDEPSRADLEEPLELVRTLRDLGVRWLNVTAGSPYYVPHIQRPAAFPPSDGYAPPEDPLVGVVRLLDVARRIKAAVPEMVVVSTGWSYLQEYIAPVAQACIRDGWFDAIGLGRMVLAYPELPADVLGGRPVQRKRLCRTFSDCTTAPRAGLVSGCYPLDAFYRGRPEYEALQTVKRGQRRSG
ncbi:MAG: NADH:flavin oxidoreductase [Deltaproteobacteria bacterium]|nr:NADH:flavin oxidoreductase [Deltaproteobacteria bacterium]